MRISILASLIMLSSSTFIMAQDVRFGVKGGVNSSNASIQGDFNGQSATSFHLGVMMEAVYTEKIAIQTEIFYTEQGFSYVENTLNRDFKLTYIQWPVMVKYVLFPKVMIEAGPQIGFLNTAKLKTQVNDSPSKEINAKGGLRSNELSFNLGSGYQLDNGLNFNVRYSYGLTNIAGRFVGEKFKNRVLQFSVGYFF